MGASDSHLLVQDFQSPGVKVVMLRTTRASVLAPPFADRRTALEEGAPEERSSLAGGLGRGVCSAPASGLLADGGVHGSAASGAGTNGGGGSVSGEEGAGISLAVALRLRLPLPLPLSVALTRPPFAFCGRDGPRARATGAEIQAAIE